MEDFTPFIWGGGGALGGSLLVIVRGLAVALRDHWTAKDKLHAEGLVVARAAVHALGQLSSSVGMLAGRGREHSGPIHVAPGTDLSAHAGAPPHG